MIIKIIMIIMIIRSLCVLRPHRGDIPGGQFGLANFLSRPQSGFPSLADNHAQIQMCLFVNNYDNTCNNNYNKIILNHIETMQNQMGIIYNHKKTHKIM